MNIINENETELISAIISGDQKAFEHLVKIYSGRLFYFAKTFGLNNDEAKDIVQESFFKIWKNFRKYNKRFSLKTWIYSITKNTIIDSLRKTKHPAFSEYFDQDEEIDFEDSNASFEEILMQNQEKEEISKAVESLNDNYRKIILLHYEEELTFEEISRLLDKSINTLKSWHFRAIKELKRLLGVIST